MKTPVMVRLGLGQLAGYQNYTDVQLSEIDTNECTELLVDNFMELIPTENIMQALSIWTTKIRHGGLLIITGTDLVQLSKACLTKTLKIPQLNEILFGKGNRSCFCLDDVVALVENFGLKIVTKRLNEYKYTIIAERP